MPRRLNVTLNWDGPYEDPNAVPTRAGIYMVIAGSRASSGDWSTGSYELLDIGQSVCAAHTPVLRWQYVAYTNPSA